MCINPIIECRIELHPAANKYMKESIASTSVLAFGVGLNGLSNR